MADQTVRLIATTSPNTPSHRNSLTAMDEEEIYVCQACGHEDHADKFGKHCPACGADLDELEAEMQTVSPQQADDAGLANVRSVTPPAPAPR